MRAPYVVGRAGSPQPSLGGSIWRPRPFLAVRITGPIASALRDGVLDTGADDTVFPEWVASAIGLELDHAEQRNVGLVGRRAVRCHYVSAELRITDGVRETYQWTAIVGFVASVLLDRPLLGYAGFLQFFDAEFHGADREVILTPNPSFPGVRT